MGKEPSRLRQGATDVLLLFPVFKRGTLQDRVTTMFARGDCFGEYELLTIFKGIVSGVRAMHNATPALAHRDLKLANVLLADRDVPALTDLGSATIATVEVTSRGQALQLQETASEHSSMPYAAMHS